MSKKILAAVVSAVMLICMAGCSGKYVMTEEDIAVQKSLVGYWLADDSTGYNSYDGNGNFLSLTAVEFTEDYKFLLHDCMPGDSEADGYVMSYNPVSYTIEDRMFRVDENGMANYAKISVSEDGQILYWITEGQTDRYNRLTDEQAADMGIPKYDPEAWTETEAGSESVPESGADSSDSSETTAAETESGTDTVSENAAEGTADEASALNNLVLNPDIKYIASLSHDDYRNYVIAEPENSGITVYGMYGTDNIIIEHDGVTDIFKQKWYSDSFAVQPEAGYADYDDDGEKELAIVYDMYDSDVKPDLLVIYEKGADGRFEEHRFENAKEVAQSEFERAEAVLGDIIHFEITSFKPAGDIIEFVAMPEFNKNGSRYISAVVTYGEDGFGLTNYKYGRQEEAAALADLQLDPSAKYEESGAVPYKSYVIAETDGIVIYAMENTDNVIITHDGVTDIFREQGWRTPRRIMPRAACGDYDGDGEKELAVSYYVGSGTGISVDQLVIYKKGEDGHFTAHKFESPENILNEKLTVEVDEENTSVTFNFDGKSVTHNYGEEFEWIKEIFSKQEEAKFYFGDIISYSFEGNKITMTSPAGLLTRFYAVGVAADVEYKDGEFTLTNFVIAEEE